jgi:hypothetical protein
LASTRARASEPPALVALEWSVPDGCPDAAHVEREVERLLADVSRAGGPYLQARAQVRQEKSGLWNVELRTAGPQGRGQRTLSAESCVALADATALILALAIDPERVAANRSTESPAPPATAQPAAVRAAPPPIPTPTRRSVANRAIALAADASAVLDIGTLPTATPGVAATLAVIPSAIPFLRLETGADVFLDSTTTNPPTRSGRFSLRTFHAGVCVVNPGGRWEVGACGGVEIAWLSAAGLYESVPSPGDAEWLVLRARATVAYIWSSAWAARADLGAGLDMSRPAFVSAGAEQGLIHQPARYTGRGALGIELRF